MNLEQRIARLEGQNKRLRLFCAVIGALFLSTIAAGATLNQAGRTVQAERFDLIDRDGRVRAYANVDDGGGVAWRFVDLNGKIRTLIGVDRTADVIFYDRSGRRTFTVNEVGIAKN